VGLVLLRAATAKIANFVTFQTTISGLGVPRRIVRYAAFIFVLAEGCLALWALSGWSAQVAAVACLVFLAGLVSVSAYAMATGRNVSCSCFGASDRPLGRQTLFLSGPLLLAQATYALIGSTAATYPTAGFAELPVAYALALVLIALSAILAVGPTFVMIVRHRRRLAKAMAVESGPVRSTG